MDSERKARLLFLKLTNISTAYT